MNGHNRLHAPEELVSLEICLEIYTEPDDFGTVMEALEGKGYEFVSADVSMIPSTYTKIEDEEAAEKMQKLLDILDDNDDVQNVYHNWDMPDEPDED